MNENEIIKRIKRDLQVPVYFKGYGLFFETIGIFLTVPETYIVKDVYYTLSKKYNLSISQVENRLHNIVKYLWKNKDLSCYNISKEGVCPSNKYFFLQIISYYLEPEA